jgi:gamma-glutamyl:cysteine ligase YbdK (ATP-grasp superfamily)
MKHKSRMLNSRKKKYPTHIFQDPKFSKCRRRMDAVAKRYADSRYSCLQDALEDLMADIGHYADFKGIDYLELVKYGVKNWHVERSKGYHTNKICDVDIDIGPLN